MLVTRLDIWESQCPVGPFRMGIRVSHYYVLIGSKLSGLSASVKLRASTKMGDYSGNLELGNSEPKLNFDFQ